MKRDFATYQVAFKILLKKGNKFLFLRTSKGDFWDLAGGRADNVEGKTPLKKILSREVREELGSEIKYKLGRIIFQYRRYNKSRKIYNLITIHEAKYISGKIKLSNEHRSYEWINPAKFKFDRNDFFNAEEFSVFKDYFKFK